MSALRELYRLGMEANGVRPMPVAPWKGREPPQFYDYALLGLPLEANEPIEREGPQGPQIGHRVTLKLVGVERAALETSDTQVDPWGQGALTRPAPWIASAELV